MLKHIGALAIAPLLFVAASHAHATGHAEAQLRLSLVVVPSCRIATRDDSLDFGSVATGTAVQRRAYGGFDINCTRGQPYKIGFDNGLHGDGSTRRLAAGDATVNYQMYANNDPDLPLGAIDSGMALRGIGNGTEQHIPVTAQIRSQGVANPGRYTDVVRVTLVW
jgi:spore coat protein U domain-containing protein, fimbrial subunit CupE1/2/3/6